MWYTICEELLTMEAGQGVVMAIETTPFTVGSLCDGCAWSVPNVDLLATQIALVAVGQADHLAEILTASGMPQLDADNIARSEAIKLVTANAENPYHRDGWLFQVMSWICAHRLSVGATIRTPHMILAHKGLDGLQVETGQNGISQVVIFEDKATDNPRDVIRDDVWPEFRDLESGSRQNVIAAEVVALLKGSGYTNPSEAVKNIIWGESRAFKASITVGNYHASPEGLMSLFSDYDDVVKGNKSRRRGDIFQVADLRGWMEALAARVITVLESGVKSV
ncbi:hypothetical protein VDG09_06450 [Xanthomonas campestris pv. raphani]|uniref:hypothetical protein n=1 Tax=Xanthomonas campestris TaxID=339 RepID=UPI002B22EC79|nr:hypothetical protein [Xanthomonas campestris]MEA9827292.1 hypothetical protein [Xanthomonas campestris pv. raphani]